MYPPPTVFFFKAKMKKITGRIFFFYCHPVEDMFSRQKEEKNKIIIIFYKYTVSTMFSRLRPRVRKSHVVAKERRRKEKKNSPVMAGFF